MPIPNGVLCLPLRISFKKSTIAQSYTRVIFVGSIELDRKGLDVLIDAVEILVELYPCLDLQLLGMALIFLF